MLPCLLLDHIFCVVVGKWVGGYKSDVATVEK